MTVFPGHVVQRISTQRSCFTVHGSNPAGLDELHLLRGSRLVKFVIPSFQAETIRRELETCGIDETTVFPDLEGLSRALCVKWRTEGLVRPHDKVYTRQRRSPIGGVGVFAIRKIRKGTQLFEGDTGEMKWVGVDSVGRQPKEIRNLYEDFAVLKNGRYGCPPTFNRLTMSWYLNESNNPNVRCDENYDFFALRDIAAGDELTTDYSTYSEPPEERGPA